MNLAIFIIAVGLFIVVLFYYYDFYLNVSLGLDVRTKREFWFGLIPFQRWFAQFINGYNKLD